MKLKNTLVTLVAALLIFFVSGAAFATVTQSVMTVRLSVMEAGNSMRLINPLTNEVILASKVGINWGYVVLDNVDDALKVYLEAGNRFLVTSPSSWPSILNNYLAQGFQEAASTDLAEGIRKVGTAPNMGTLIRYITTAMGTFGVRAMQRKEEDEQTS